MRLFTHLVLSHSAPVLVVTLAFALTVTAVVRISMILTTLHESELVTLQKEGALHQSTWALDVAMRHEQTSCTTGDASPASIRALLSRESATLSRQVASASPSAMRTLAERHLAIAEEILRGDVCTELSRPDVVARRARLDEELTDLWVDRLDELHASMQAKDEHARSIAIFAAWTGIPLAIASFLLAMFVARRLARMVNGPLASLARMARRVGTGDFHTSVRVQGPAEILALAEDLERMRIQLQQLDTLKQGFLASVSHELRTPLSKVREALALLQDGAVGALDSRQGRVVQIARDACEQEIRLVTTLLDFSRLRAGNPVQQERGVAIDVVLQGAVGDERLAAANRGVDLRLALDTAGARCCMDPVLVERAIANLVRNAVLVSSRGGEVRVQASRCGAGVRITVSDDGPGVPAAVRESMFDPFVTHAVPGSAKVSGVGIGLALAREVAEAHDGTLELAHSDDAGTTFALWLPLDSQVEADATDEDAEPRTRSSASTSTTQHPGKARQESTSASP